MSNRIGQENCNNQGYMMTIVAYRNAKDIDVKFIDGTVITNKKYCDFKKGIIKNPNCASVHNVGFIGQGTYSPKNHKDAHEYWRGMLRRCYDSQYQLKRSTYIGCEVCEEWHCFQNFAKWFYDNYYEVPDQTMALDKDILCKGNKIYSPDTCVFVSQDINKLFTKSNTKRGELPIGVNFKEKNNKYQASCSDGSNHKIYLGLYNTPEEAFEAYKQYKEQTIKDIAEEYRKVIPEVLYNAMINYEVEIED